MTFFDKLLTIWYDAGLTTADEVRSFEAARRQEHLRQRQAGTPGGEAQAARRRAKPQHSPEGNFQQRDYPDDYWDQFINEWPAEAAMSNGDTSEAGDAKG